MSSEFLDFLGTKKTSSVDEKLQRIMETMEVLSSIVSDKLPTIINQQVQMLQQQIDALNARLNAGGGGMAGAPMPPGMSGAPMPPGMSGAPMPPGMGNPGMPLPPGMGPPPPGGPPPPPGPRPPGAGGPMSLKASIMDELKGLLAKRRSE